LPPRPSVHRPHGVALTPGGQIQDARASAARRGYDRDWEKFRRSILMERPLCQDCLPGGVTPASEVHHIIKLRDRRDLRLSPANVMSLCKSCHSIRTARGE
jgi:5-methylcytosine-specific restriction protein A